MDDGNTWPEQEAVDAWLSDMGLDIDNRDSMKLKEAVTKPRIAIQHKAADLKQQLEEANRAVEEAEARMDEAMTDHCQERAHADALAGALRKAVNIIEAAYEEIDEDGTRMVEYTVAEDHSMMLSVLNEHRQAREEGE